MNISTFDGVRMMADCDATILQYLRSQGIDVAVRKSARTETRYVRVGRTEYRYAAGMEAAERAMSRLQSAAALAA